MDLSELLSRAREDGYTTSFSCAGGCLVCADSGREYRASEAWIVDSRSVDQGTDPGDDATMYLIETRDGRRGYLVIGDSFHADPRDAAFIDRLEWRRD